MLKVLKNLKESWLSVIAIVLLLIVQAAGDLTLPDYTSKIVNIGIQSGGIENPAPEVIRKSEMDNLLIFTEDDEQILNDYKEISKENLDEKEYEKLVKKYSALENETLYEVKKLNSEEQTQLNNMMTKPLMMLGSLENEETANSMKEQMLSSMSANIPEQQKITMQNMELIDIIKQMPKEQVDKMLETVNEKLDNMQNSILEQAAIQQVKKEYKAIGINTDNLQNKYIIISGLKMLGISFIIMASAISIMCLSARVAAKLAKTLREKTFRKVLKFSNKEFSEYSTASLITRSTNDIQQIQGLIAILFRVLVYAPIIGIGGFLRVLSQSDNSMAWIIGVAILAILVVVATLFIIAMPRFKKLQELIDKLNLVAREILTGLPVIRAFNTEKKEEKRFDKANVDLTKTNLFVNRAMSFMMPTLMLIMNAISLLIVWVGAHGIDNGTMQVGNMMAFIQYTMQIVMSFLMISMVSIMLPRASVSANRINEILETEEAIQESKEPKKLDTNKKGLVEFKNVSFRYPDSDEEVLSDITFTAKPGETTAIIGSTGSGKSTTLAAMIDFISSMRNCHILTIEDPIEYVYQQKQALIHQREVHEDVDSFDTALKSAMREDPDVILVGEMRDYETIQAVITLAETGHLVFSTLHTIGAPKTIDRIIDVFPPHKQAQIRAQLASVLQAVVTQQLLPLASGKGRAAALEIMIANDAIKNLIRENKGHQIDTMIQTGRNEGMTTLNASLATLVNTGKVNRMVAERYSLDVGELRQLIR